MGDEFEFKRTVKILSKNQITIPITIVRELKIKKGDYYLVGTKDGQILLSPAVITIKKY